jgi:hypothetical protein
MKRILNFCSVLYLIWTISTLILIFSGKVTFGHGLGDLFYLILLTILLIFFGYLFYLNIKWRKKIQVVISLLLIIIVILFTLKMTIWRGIEYPWNGNILFQ